MSLKYIILILTLVLASCSVRRKLPAGETIYRGPTIKIEKAPGVTTSTKKLRSELKQAATPRPNKFLLGHPQKVWWWYKLGGAKPNKKEKGFWFFLRNKLGEAPVFGSRVNAKASAENMQSLLENLGYFHSTAQGDTTHYRYFTRAIYHAQVKPQYFIREIKWISDSSAVMKMLMQGQKRYSILKPGNPYQLKEINAERDRLDLFLKMRGYYYFNPDYLMVYADSTIGDRKVDLYLNLKKTTPPEAKQAYKINTITVFPNYSLAAGQLDTSRRGLVEYDSLQIRDTVGNYKYSLFSRTITYGPGSTYSSRQQNTTLNRFINLGAFKFVKNRFDPVKDTSNGYYLNANYFLTPAKKKSVQAQIDGFAKDNNSLGTEVSVTWKNRNIFHGAEMLIIKPYVGFQVQFGDSLHKNNTFRIGAEATIRFPRYVIPSFIKIKENNFYPPNTNMTIGYDLLQKQLFYTNNLFRLQYDFTWKQTTRKQFSWAPFSLGLLHSSNVTDSFYKEAVINPSILLNVYSEVILGQYFTFIFNDARLYRKNKFYLLAGIDLSGNLAGLISGAKSFREKTIFGTPFAQYVKIDLDGHYTRRLPIGWDWASRLLFGIGMPYNNSSLLPFSKQYIIGGANSLRGFTARNIGPGSYKTTAEDQRFFQVIGGDLKLLFNSEIRIPLSKKIGGAVFVDAGNIWTKDTLLFGPAGQFSKDWYKEIAVSTGIGVRYDATVVVIRIDLGFPLRKPYLPDGQRWVWDEEIDFSKGSWRKENLIWNIAIGYPF